MRYEPGATAANRNRPRASLISVQQSPEKFRLKRVSPSAIGVGSGSGSGSLTTGAAFCSGGESVAISGSGCGGTAGVAPLIGLGDAEEFSDPLPQALALTSIVITFGVTAFLFALGYRSWRITHDDVVEDDVEDRFVARQRRDVELDEGEKAERELAAEEDRP